MSFSSAFINSACNPYIPHLHRLVKVLFWFINMTLTEHLLWHIFSFFTHLFLCIFQISCGKKVSTVVTSIGHVWQYNFDCGVWKNLSNLFYAEIPDKELGKIVKVCNGDTLNVALSDTGNELRVFDVFIINLVTYLWKLSLRCCLLYAECS